MPRPTMHKLGFRWSLRSLLAFVAVSAVASRYVGGEFMAYDAEQRGLAAVSNVGPVRPDTPYKTFY